MSTTVIFESSKPVKVPGAILTELDGDEYITGLSTGGSAYYWGRYGYRIDETYLHITSCSISGCSPIGQVWDGQIVLASQPNTHNMTGPGAGTTTHNSGQGVGQHISVDHDGKMSVSVTAGGTKKNDNNGSASNSCGPVTHYGFNKEAIVTPIGQKVATVPPAWPAAQSGIKALSGNVYDGLFCAALTTAPNFAQCDAHGTSVTEGQTGSNTTSSGPQQVVATGWLNGKSITTLSTGSTGYTCAIASGSVGCWGVNTKGQLGVGDTTLRKTPTGIGL